jgi:hypothetical protein
MEADAFLLLLSPWIKTPSFIGGDTTQLQRTTPFNLIDCRRTTRLLHET